jgi:hypothetical protein
VSVLVLDSEAVSRLARAGSGTAPGAVQAALKASLATGAEVLTPAAALSEQCRGDRHDQIVDACLSRHRSIQIVDTTQALARRVGHLLARAGRGSADHVDATVVATAVLGGGGLIITSDPDDLGALADGLPGVTIARV